MPISTRAAALNGGVLTSPNQWLVRNRTPGRHGRSGTHTRMILASSHMSTVTYAEWALPNLALERTVRLRLLRSGFRPPQNANTLAGRESLSATTVEAV